MDYMHDMDSILEQYKALVDRFDSLIPPSATAGGTDPATTLTKHSHSYDPSRTKNNSKNNNTRDKSIKTNSRHPKQVSDGQISKKAENHDDKGGILAWLQHVLDSEDNVRDVSVALKKYFHMTDSILKSETILGDDTVDGYSLMDQHEKSMLPVRTLQNGPKLDRAVSVLDRTLPSNTHKVAILYAWHILLIDIS